MADVTPIHYGRHKNVQKEPIPVQTNAGSYGVIGGGAATVTLKPSSANGVCIDFIDFGYRVAPTGGSIQISDGTLTWGPFTIVLAGLQTREFDPPLGPFTKNTTVTVTLADGGQTKDLFVQGHLDGTEVY